MTDEELIARLRWKAGAYAKEAADRIEQLVATNKELVKRLDAVKDKAEARIIDLMAERDRVEARAERLEAAIDYILDGMAIDAPDYEIDPDDNFLDAANSDWVRDVLTRLAAALRGEGRG